jgi:hypothetical protein
MYVARWIQYSHEVWLGRYPKENYALQEYSYTRTKITYGRMNENKKREIENYLQSIASDNTDGGTNTYIDNETFADIVDWIDTYAQEVAKEALAPAFTLDELAHIEHLLVLAKEKGDYTGKKTNYYKRTESLLSKIRELAGGVK